MKPQIVCLENGLTKENQTLEKICLNIKYIERIKYADVNWYHFCNFFIILIEMDKSEIRKMYNFNFIRGGKN